MAKLKRCKNNDCKTTWALGDNCPKCGLGFRPTPSDNESVEKNNSFWDACVFYFASALMVMSFWLAMMIVAIYRRSYSRVGSLGQMAAIAILCIGLIWQVTSSVQGEFHESPAVVYPLEGLWLVVVGWVGWVASLSGVHEVPGLESPPGKTGKPMR